MPDSVHFGYGGIGDRSFGFTIRIGATDSGELYVMMVKNGVGTIDSAPTNWYAVDVRHE